VFFFPSCVLYVLRCGAAVGEGLGVVPTASVMEAERASAEITCSSTGMVWRFSSISFCWESWLSSLYFAS
jgi:hypothetical protein